jgi:Domain of unknown function (DUF222)/HNH endonuclease
VRAQAQVTVVVDWHTLQRSVPGRTDGQFTGPIHPSDVQRLLCDSTITRVVTGPSGMPLDVGRAARTVPPPMRRALAARDAGCRFPGCDRPPGWCEAHHVVPFSEGGDTSPGNLVLLCDRHHHVVHAVGWSAAFDGTTLEVRRPDGSTVL